MAESGESRNVRDLFVNSIRTLAEVIEAKDPYTAGHSRRVTALSMQIAAEMGLPRTKVAQIRLAAMLHDIGKIGVKESVLNKEGALSDEEYKHVLQHTEIGRRILEPIFSGSEILKIVSHHHEHFDGSGHPDNLKGTAIPIGARVILLADAVDAMGSERPYRSCLPPGEIIAEVRKCAGTQFDPQVVESFLRTACCEGLLKRSEEEAATGGGEADACEGIVEVASEAEGEEERGAEAVEYPEEPPERPLYYHKHTIGTIRDLKEIKALPFVTAEILSLTSTASSSIDVLVKTIMRDPALVAKILKLSNTSYYASRERIQTIERAVVNIGYAGIREVALGVALVDLLQRKETAGGLDRLLLWRHQLATGVLARALAAACGVAAPEDAFVAGLLHDLGIAILDDIYPQEYIRCTRYAINKGAPLVEAERAWFDIDHAQAGAEVAKVWNLPEKFRRPIELHHETWKELSGLAKADGAVVMLVKLASALACARNAGSDCDMVLEEVPRGVFGKLNLDGEAAAEVMGSFRQELAELEMIFLMNTNSDRGTLEDPTSPEEYGGRQALFVTPNEKPIDIVREYVETLGMKTRTAGSVGGGMEGEAPDIVFVRGSSEVPVEGSLKALRDLSREGTVGAVKVIVLQGASQNGNGKLASVYPANCTAVMKEPYSTAKLQREMTLLFGN